MYLRFHSIRWLPISRDSGYGEHVVYISVVYSKRLWTSKQPAMGGWIITFGNLILDEYEKNKIFGK
jgi:hypothetical protein